VDEAEIGAVQLVEAREEAAEVLELVDTTFHQVALAVEPGVIRALHLGGLMRRDDRFAALGLNVGNEGRARIAAIRDHPLEGEPGEQCFRLRAVVALPSGQAGAQGIA